MILKRKDDKLNYPLFHLMHLSWFDGCRFEVTLGADENSRIKMAMTTAPRNKRDTRSAIFGFSSPDFGNFDFELSQGKN